MYFTENELRDAVNNHTTISGTLMSLNLPRNSTHYKRFHKAIERFNISIEHFCRPAPSNSSFVTRPLAEILVKNSDYLYTQNLKRRLVNEGLLESKCSVEECGITHSWLGQPISLQLDHIDGDRANNEIENLRLLCPNCHSQTPTYAGKKLRREPRKCRLCNAGLWKGNSSGLCRSCNNRMREQDKIDWPDVEELAGMVSRTSYVATGKALGVSDTAVRKRLRRLRN